MAPARLLLSAALFLLLPLAGARSDDPPAPAPAKAARRPVTGREALVPFRKQDWPRTVELYEQVLRANPNDGQHWHNYGFALHSLKRYDEAIRAEQKAIELGFQPATEMYNIACACALQGKKDEALGWLRKALDAGFTQDGLVRTDTDLDSLRGDPRFQKLLGAPPEGLPRAERWAFDLDYLARRMEKIHYNLYAKVSREKFREAVDGLKRQADDLKDDEMAVGVQRILAMVGDGHTTLMWHNPGPRPPQRYPVELYLYKEGLYVRGAAPEYAGVFGGKVLRVGNASAEKALEAAAPLCSRDNDMGVKLWAARLLTVPAVISYLRLADDPARLPLLVRKRDGGEETVELRPVPGDPESARGFVYANAGAKGPEPVSFKKNGDPFWFEYLPERKLVYFQYNQVGNKPDETLEQFCGRLFTFINGNPVERLVIDLRNNSGGNNFLNRPLVHGLIRCDKVNRTGHLFVLAGRRTFSAAMNGAVDIERNTDALFVGEPTGSSPNFVGETTVLVLPCSGLRFSCSSLYWQSSTAMDRRRWIAPDLVAEPSIEAFSQNRDPALEAVFAYLDAGPADGR
jgi:tetratricopeptide (TPR) repeat protein